jgi:cephalosporin hydroxylase
MQPLKSMRFRARHSRVYLRTGAALLRRDPRRLYEFTDAILRAEQLPEEFVPFLELLEQERPSSVLKIGTRHGATLFMMCEVVAADAHLATLDLQLPPARVLRSCGRRRQTVVHLEGDSHDPTVHGRVVRLFGDGLDLLFIDGDHSFEGVSADFESYESLVRPGGLVVFHDIVEDSRAGVGVPTGGSAGEVPQFWRQFKERWGGTWRTTEFVRSWDQDGLGIGVAVKPG